MGEGLARGGEAACVRGVSSARARAVVRRAVRVLTVWGEDVLQARVFVLEGGSGIGDRAC